MLQIVIPETKECWNEKTEEFMSCKKQVLQLEHSLVSISKWEAKWCKPFLSRDKMSQEEALDYVKCMTLTQNVNDYVYLLLTDENMKEINAYIDAPMTATWFGASKKDGKGSGKKEIITSEVIYYWMISLSIPFECQKWHLNRLLTLIRVCNAKNTPSKKLSSNELLSRNSKLNAMRKAQLHSRG